MREIKFRQWVKRRDGTGYFHYWGHVEKGVFNSPIGEVEWDERKSEQYTGLKDRDGKEIYEGDVVRWHLDDIDKYAVIEGIPGGFMVQGVRNIPRFCTDILHFIPTDDAKYCKYEVIGNIHENPELLMGGSK